MEKAPSTLSSASAGRQLSDEMVKAAKKSMEVSSINMPSHGSARRLSDEMVKAAKKSMHFSQSQAPATSLAQLRISNMKLHGREEDMKLLKTKLHGLTAKKIDDKKEAPVSSLPEILLVAGVSGTGKSALVARGLSEPAKRMGIAFAGGKFDLNKAAHLPLSAFSTAMSTLTKHVIESEQREKITNEIKREFSEEDLEMIAGTLPGCRGLLGRQLHVSVMERGENTRSSMCMQSGKEVIKRQQYAIGRLLRIICTNLKGVVLFIDDLQWSDTATLALLQRISLDDSIPSLLLVGAYREDEVPESHPLALHIREIEQMGIDIPTIRIGNLAAVNVKSLVAEALGMEDDEDAVGTLSATVHEKTEGNAFFVLMFLRSLREEELLTYNFGIMNWMWDDNAVKRKLMTENVATVMVNKLQRMKRSSQRVLMIASCLGAVFSASVVATIYDSISDAGSDPDGQTHTDDESMSIVSLSSREFETEGLWESESDQIRRFSHDKVQQAAFELIPAEQRDSFRGEIGSILMEKLDAEALNEYLFEVVSLRNCAMDSMSGNKRIALASMNLQAGLRATSKAAFDTAVVYFKAGRMLLGDTAWEVDPGAMLQICSEEANACFINGDLETMKFLIDEVLTKDIPVKDKFRVYETKILAAMGSGHFCVAVATALSVRQQLGLPSPPNKPASSFTVLKDFLKTQRMLKNKTAEDIANLPELRDETIIMGQRLLETLIESTYMAQPTIYPLIACLIVRTSLRYGINASSIDGVNNFGLLLCTAFGGRLEQGREMAKAAEMILDKCLGTARMKSRAAFHIDGLILWWTNPVQSVLGGLLQGYQIGLETGDVGSACYNLLFRVSAVWFSSRPLEGFQSELETAVTVMERLNQSGQRWGVIVYLLAVKQLRGVSTQEESFGTIMNVVVETGNAMLRSCLYAVRLELLVMSQDWEAATKLLHEAGDIRPSIPDVDVAHIRFTFIETLICLHNAQASSGWLEKRMWKKRCQKLIKLIRSWVDKGCVNMVHCLLLVSAQYAVLRGKKKDAENKFKAAIAAAARSGFLHDRALSHELASVFFARQGEDYWENYHMECSQKCYLDWGATSKVVQK